MARPRSASANRAALDAAVEVLFEGGIDGVTLEEVAARSGVAKSTLYRHFGSKEALVAEAARTCLVEYPTPDTGALLTDVSELFGRYKLGQAAERSHDLLLLLVEAAPRHPDLQELLADLLAERRRPLLTVLKLAQQRGEIAADLDLEVALAVFVGPFTYWRTIEGREITADFMQTVLEAAVAGLHAGARAGSTPTPA